MPLSESLLASMSGHSIPRMYFCGGKTSNKYAKQINVWTLLQAEIFCPKNTPVGFKEKPASLTISSTTSAPVTFMQLRLHYFLQGDPTYPTCVTKNSEIKCFVQWPPLVYIFILLNHTRELHLWRLVRNMSKSSGFISITRLQNACWRHTKNMLVSL